MIGDKKLREALVMALIYSTPEDGAARSRHWQKTTGEILDRWDELIFREQQLKELATLVKDIDEILEKQAVLEPA